MSGYRAWYAVVAVEQRPPKELISGDSQPLSAGQTSSQHGIMGQTQEDLQHQAVRQNRFTLHPNILRTAHTSQVHRCNVMLQKRQPLNIQFALFVSPQVPLRLLKSFYSINILVTAIHQSYMT